MTHQRGWNSVHAPIEFDEALRRVLASVTALQSADASLIDAFGLTLAADIVASRDVPPFDNAAMDGYALRAIDTLDPLARSLRVVDSIAAGDARHVEVGPREAARIMTGAPIPSGADAVIRFEETDELERRADEREWVSISRAVQPGENIRFAGEDIRRGTTSLCAGMSLGPAEIGLLAATNVSTVPVHRRPVVAILSTGDELVEPGSASHPGQVCDSNSYVIHALVRQAGGEPRVLGVARDTQSDLLDRLGSGSRPDLYVTSGGVSVGDYDVVKDVLQAHGSIDVWQVHMKPGRPLAFGHIDNTPLLGLPGNPLAAFVSFLQFGRPLIRKMLGKSDLTLPQVEARLTRSLDNRGNRRQFALGVVAREEARLIACPAGSRGSGILSPSGQVNCLIVVPETLDRLEADAPVNVQIFDGVQV